MATTSEPAREPTQGAGELSPEVFRRIVDDSAHTFLVLAPDGTLRYVGGSSAAALGWAPHELLGRNMAEFLTPEGVEQAVATLAEIDASDRDGAGVPMVFEILQRDGTTAWVEVGAIPLLDLAGVEGIVLRCRPWGDQRHFEEFLASLLADDALPDVLTPLCRSIATSLQATGAVVHHAFDGQAFASAAGAGVPVAMLATPGPWVEVAKTGAVVEADVDELGGEVAAVATAAGLGACWVAPVPGLGGLAPAVLTVWRPQRGRMLRGHHQALGRALSHVQLALLRHAEHQRLLHLAGHDSLTGVANRSQFRARLAAALAIGERDLAVAFCDLDGFKTVNDTFGHIRGDAVLVDVAERLRSSLRTGDEMARMGGDEFTVLLRNVVDAESANHVVDRLLGALREPMRVDGTPVPLGLSIGVALAGPDSTADSLLARADEALYAVKRAGGGAALVVGGAR